MNGFDQAGFSFHKFRDSAKALIGSLIRDVFLYFGQKFSHPNQIKKIRNVPGR